MRRLAVGILCLIQFVDVLGVTTATTAIPAILAGVGVDESAAGPLATTYALFFGGLLVVGARLGDKFGHRKVLVSGLIGFTAVSVVGGTSDSLLQVLMARSLQGASAAISVPSALRLLLYVSRGEKERHTALAAWSAAGAAAGGAGFVMGGALVEVWDWRAVFWVNAPIGLILLCALLVVVPEIAAGKDITKIDYLGAGLLVSSLMLLVAGASVVEQRGNPLTAGLLIAGGALLCVAFCLQLRNAANPLIPWAAVRSVNLRHGTVLSFVNTATTSSSSVLVTLYLQEQLGLSALNAGLTLMIFSLLVVLGSLLSKPALARWSTYQTAALGISVIAAGNLTLVLFGAFWLGSFIGMAMTGFGIGVSSVAATALGTSVSESIAGSASGILNTGAQLGTVVGTALVVAIAAISSSIWGWGIAFALAACAALWALIAGHPVREERRA